MTKYESLIRKCEICLESAKKTDGPMQAVWLGKATALKQLADGLSWEDANREVENENQNN